MDIGHITYFDIFRKASQHKRNTGIQPQYFFNAAFQIFKMRQVFQCTKSIGFTEN